jgi:hypothetical protein
MLSGKHNLRMRMQNSTNNDDSLPSQGGKARAAKLSSEEKKAIASKAAAARWSKDLPAATNEGNLNIGGVEFDAAVINYGGEAIRVIGQSEFMRAVGMYYSGFIAKQHREAAEGGSAVLPMFLAQKALKPFISNALDPLQFAPISYRSKGGQVAKGIPAKAIPKICKVWIDAKNAGALKPKQQAIAEMLEIIYHGLAETGIIALVDEATGYQYERPRRDLEEQLRKFLSDTLRSWVQTFPSEYFKHLCRLRGVELRENMRLPQYFGKLTNNLVYRRIAPGLLRKLKERREELGGKSAKLHSVLSEDIGLRALLVHLGTVVGLMKVNTDYDAFEKQLNTIAPVYPNDPGLFDDPKDWEEPT